MVIPRPPIARAAVLAGSLCFVAPSHGDWFRDFNSGTLQDQGLVEIDPTQIFGGPDEFVPSLANGSLRMGFAGGATDDDSGVMFYPETFPDASMLMRIRWSTNPFLAASGGSEMNGGFIVRWNPSTFQGYIVVNDDNGYLAISKLVPNPPSVDIVDVCPEGVITLNPFDASRDWWMRAEYLDNGQGGVVLRARMWPDDQVEPCGWQVECTDTTGVYPPGYVGVLANEDHGGNGQYVDLDDLSVTSQMFVQEVCDNGLDDDCDEKIDCADSDCDVSPACACHDPFADSDGDGDVDQDDFAHLQLCYTGADDLSHEFAGTSYCDCFDRDQADPTRAFRRSMDGDDDIDQDDVLAFERCAGGPEIQARAECDDPLLPTGDTP